MTDFLDWLVQLELLEPHLTPTELRFAGLFGRHLGDWLPRSMLVTMLAHDPEYSLALYDDGDVRTYVWRLRRKLRDTPWRIQSRPGHGLYRLVHTP